MNKKLFVTILFIIFSFIIHINEVNAATSYITITANDIVIRTGPATTYNKITNVNKNSIFYLNNTAIVADEAKNGKCDEGWYNIIYQNEKAYICSRYAKATVMIADEACEEELKKQGFPTDYVTSLCELKSIHKEWSFIPVNTDLDWKTAVEKESLCGKSYVYLTTSKDDYIDKTCKSQYPDSSPWKPASQKAVAYYMDPRNWFDEQNIFQFNTNKYENSLKEAYVSLSKHTIKNANFYTYHLGIGNDLADIINQAGSETNVSPIFLSSRMIQELGSGTAEYNLYSGIVAGFESLYNFYNIGVTDACATTYGVTHCGLTYARKVGWTTPLLAIKGGSSIVSEGYINAGQYTTYLQKFNVVPNTINKLYNHQYMTNIGAPSSEAKTAYNTYKSVDVLESPFVFYIPIYKNMTENVINTPSGATGGTVESNLSKSSASTIITSAGFKYSSNNVLGFQPGNLIENIIGSLESIAGNGNVKIFNANNEEVKTGIIATGYKIQIKNSEGTSNLGVILKGDTSGDGVINALDLLQVQKNILNTFELKDLYKLAADTSGDGVVNALDLLHIQKNILGTYTIVQ